MRYKEELLRQLSLAVANLLDDVKDIKKKDLNHIQNIITKLENQHTITIVVEGGMVVEVRNIPPNFCYKILDRDIDDMLDRDIDDKDIDE